MSDIARPDDLRRQNRRRVVAALRRGGPQSRTELSAATGLSHSTVTLITAALLEDGSVIEADSSIGFIRRGRPQQALSLNPQAASVAVVTLTLNRISASIIDYAGVAEAERILRIPTQSASLGELRSAMLGVLREALASGNAMRGPLRHIAVAVQGITGADGAELLWSPVTPLSRIPVARWMSEEFRVASTVANDCNMIAEALRWAQPEQYGDNFAAILLSHGIGMGLYLQGRPFTGIRSSAAEFGHMCFDPHGASCRCGRRGCIEAYAGDYAIWRAARGGNVMEVPGVDLDFSAMAQIAGTARSRPGAEREAYRRAGEAIGAGLRSLFALFDTFPVAMVGSGAHAWDLIEPGLREAIGRDAMGVGGEEAPIFCHADEFPLIRDGAMVTALTSIDNRGANSGEIEEGRLTNAI